MAESYVVDTHALFWHLTSDRKLSAAARGAIERRHDPAATVLVSAISLAELYYVNQKAGKPLDFRREVQRLARDGFEIASVAVTDILLFDRLESVPEMHDRIIAALARGRGAAVVSRDRILSESAGVPVVW